MAQVHVHPFALGLEAIPDLVANRLFCYENARWIDAKASFLEGQAKGLTQASHVLIGSLVTGLLVPVFQYTQQTFSWRRQNHYDNSKYRLPMMRDCLREFVSLSAYSGEA